jgi:hypothetical protein
VIDLDGWLALRELSLEEARSRLRVPGEEGRYEGLHGVRRLHNPDVHPGHFYFDGDRQVMLYVGRRALADEDPAALAGALGGPGEELPSRAGKSSVMHVYPSRGVAFSSDGHAVELLEIFAPTTLDEYRARVWQDPGTFVK